MLKSADPPGSTNNPAVFVVSGPQTYRNPIKDDLSHVVVGAALPRVVEPETEGAGVPAFQGRVFTERTVLHTDGPVVDLHSSDGKIPADKHIHVFTVPRLKTDTFRVQLLHATR